MKQLLILSGKGGTGKTTVASAFIRLSAARAYADCDVDAPNLHLVAGWETPPETADYYGLGKAEIDGDMCIGCDLCRQHCRFGAIDENDGEYTVNSFACEGCGVCEHVCPAGAAAIVPSVDGELRLFVDDEIDGAVDCATCGEANGGADFVADGEVFSTAQLKMGSGNSGLLVTEVKNRMKERSTADFAIIDGSPGIGCPVIASLSGVDMVLIVAEPSVSGISDMERIIHTAARFGTTIAVCINKYDTNLEKTEEIEWYCREHGLPFVGRIPFDPRAVKATNSGVSIVDIDCVSGAATKEVYERTMALL